MNNEPNEETETRESDITMAKRSSAPSANNSRDRSADCAESEEPRLSSSSNTDNAESSSSSTEEKSGSGSRGGYSADCSASDQSSDEGNNKASSQQNIDNSSVNQLPLDKLGLQDTQSASIASQEAASIQKDEAKNTIHHQHHHHHHHHKRAYDQESTSGHHHHRHGVKEEDGEDDSMEEGERGESAIGFPTKSPGLINIDQILASKAQRDNESTSMLSGQLPQFNGVRIGNPMDPRIDLSSVSVLPSATPFISAPSFGLAGAFASAVQQQQQNGTTSSFKPSPDQASGEEPAPLRAQHQNQNGEDSRVVPTIDSYIQMMEMVRPFFVSHGVPYAGTTAPQHHQQDDGHQPSSSEGFTSFFTTTHSSQQSGSSSGDGQISSQQGKRDANHAAHLEKTQNGEKVINKDEDDDGTNQSDASSMVVLARVKRKHKKSEEERRVRIQEGEGKGDAEDEEEESSGSSADQKSQALPKEDVASSHADEDKDESPGSSASSTSVVVQNNAQGQEAAVGVPPRIVTDVSSSARDSNGQTTSSGSGSGSGANSGSNSNQGSSGSGNDKGSSEEGGKGGSASEEAAAREDNSGESPEGGSDRSDAQIPRAAVKAEHCHHPALHEPYFANVGLSAENESPDAMREQKLLDKKRKRIEMRREYEAQQQVESSESSDQKPEALLRPGKPVAMDEVLQFSKVARAVIQSSPPFLVVHTNAAFTRLTGIDSHKIVGRPIGHFLSSPKDLNGENTLRACEDSSSASGNPQSSENAFESGNLSLNVHNWWRSHRLRRGGVERLVAASGFGHFHLVQVLTRHSQLLGKSVSFPKEQTPPSLPPPRPQESTPPTGVATSAGVDDEQAGNSLSSATNSATNTSAAATRQISCRASIAPVVSSLDVHYARYNSIEEADPKRRKFQPQEAPSPVCEESDTKRRKLQGAMESPPRKHKDSQPREQLVTHYIIQLEMEEEGQKFGSIGSLSSHTSSVEACLVGLTKSQVKKQRAVTSTRDDEESAAAGEDDGGGSETTETPRDHVAAVG